MKLTTIRTWLPAALLSAVAFAALPHSPAAAQGTSSQPPLRIFASNAVKTLLDDLGPQCQKAAGRPLAITWGTSAGIQKSIEGGQAFDMVILATDPIEALIKEGKLSAGSRVDFARSSVGVGVRAGAPKPDISTPEAMKRALLAAKAVSFTEGGASVPFVMKMADGLGVAAQVKAKTVTGPSTDAAAAHVIDGSADLVFSMVSEIMPNKGLELVGPLPPQFDRYLNFAAAIAPNSPNAKSAAALIHYLDSPAIVPALKAKGLEPPAKGKS